jgi:hypothetical protein
MAGHGGQQIVRTLPEFCFRWLKLLGVGLAVAFAVQVLAFTPVPSAVSVPLLFMALKTLVVATVEVGRQIGPLMMQLASWLSRTGCCRCPDCCGLDCIGFCSNWPAGPHRLRLPRTIRPVALPRGRPLLSPTSSVPLAVALLRLASASFQGGAPPREGAPATAITSASPSSFATPPLTRSSSPVLRSTASSSSPS